MIVHVKWIQLVKHDPKLNDICHSMRKEPMLRNIPVKSISNNIKCLNRVLIVSCLVLQICM